eukprot:UN02084
MKLLLFKLFLKSISHLRNTCHLNIRREKLAGAGRQPCKSWVTGLWPDFEKLETCISNHLSDLHISCTSVKMVAFFKSMIQSNDK